MRLALAGVLLAAIFAAGCGEDNPFKQGTDRRSAAPDAVGVVVDDPLESPPPAPPPPAPRQAKPEKPVAKKGADAGAPPPPPPPPPSKRDTEASEPDSPQQPAPAPRAEDPNRKKAEVGVGKKGRYRANVITVPITAYFRSKERLSFSSITHTMNLYRAEHGHYPKSHDEFMEKIIRFNNISLPDLPEGDRYVYDPQEGALMVETTK